MRFWLGTHEPGWLTVAGTPPLMVSRRRMAQRAPKRRAVTPWVLDSGGFTELSTYGRWTIDPEQYIEEAVRLHETVGSLVWMAPQDWMCEPQILERTGLTVEAHQELTIQSVLDLRRLWPDGCIIPVLQGWEPSDYERHAAHYAAAGVDLAAEPVVGLGSVCRRQATGAAEAIVMALHPLKLHGFGLKTAAFARYGALLESADSMAWSLDGRRRGSCTHLKSRCANHRHWALQWRSRVLSPDRVSLWGCRPADDKAQNPPTPASGAVS